MKHCRLSLPAMVLLCILCGVAHSVPPLKSKPPIKPVSQAVRDRVLLAAINYHFQGYPKNEPHACYLLPELGPPDASPTQQMKCQGVLLVDKDWDDYSRRPKNFAYIEIEEIKWLRPSKAKVSIYYLDSTPDPVVCSEGIQTFPVNQTKQGWRVDTRHVTVEAGE